MIIEELSDLLITYIMIQWIYNTILSFWDEYDPLEDQYMGEE